MFSVAIDFEGTLWGSLDTSVKKSIATEGLNLPPKHRFIIRSLRVPSTLAIHVERTRRDPLINLCFVGKLVVFQ